MITQTFKCNFSMSFLITRHSPIWITNDSIHCSLPSNYQNLQKVGYDIVVFNSNVLGHAWHTWCKHGTNGKRMSCSLLICHMQIFKLIDFRTMGLWIWITFFFYMHCRLAWLITIKVEPLSPNWDHENYLVISGFLLYQGKKQRNIKSWDQQNDLVIRGFCYTWPL